MRLRVRPEFQSPPSRPCLCASIRLCMGGYWHSVSIPSEPSLPLRGGRPRDGPARDARSAMSFNPLRAVPASARGPCTVCWTAAHHVSIPSEPSLPLRVNAALPPSTSRNPTSCFNPLRAVPASAALRRRVLVELLAQRVSIPSEPSLPLRAEGRGSGPRRHHRVSIPSEPSLPLREHERRFRECRFPGFNPLRAVPASARVLRRQHPRPNAHQVSIPSEPSLPLRDDSAGEHRGQLWRFNPLRAVPASARPPFSTARRHRTCVKVSRNLSHAAPPCAFSLPAHGASLAASSRQARTCTES